MLLPTKRISPSRSIIILGANLLKIINRPKSISTLWEEFKKIRFSENNQNYISYDWFILSIDFLYVIGVITVESGKIRRIKNDS